MTPQRIQKPVPLDLRAFAQTVVDKTGSKGAIVITCDDQGIRVVGVGDLKPEEFREALYTAIQYSYSGGIEDQKAC
jgi:hypothetical protein